MISGLKVIAGFLGGDAIGSILGILLAPASGKKNPEAYCSGGQIFRRRCREGS